MSEPCPLCGHPCNYVYREQGEVTPHTNTHIDPSECPYCQKTPNTYKPVYDHTDCDTKINNLLTALERVDRGIGTAWLADLDKRAEQEREQRGKSLASSTPPGADAVSLRYIRDDIVRPAIDKIKVKSVCATCGGIGRKAILICTYGHAVVWGGAPDISWEGERCNYQFLCGAPLKDSGKTAPCPDCQE